jgi:hypothetical protein
MDQFTDFDEPLSQPGGVGVALRQVYKSSLALFNNL